MSTLNGSLKVSSLAVWKRPCSLLHAMEHVMQGCSASVHLYTQLSSVMVVLFAELTKWIVRTLGIWMLKNVKELCLLEILSNLMVLCFILTFCKSCKKCLLTCYNFQAFKGLDSCYDCSFLAVNNPVLIVVNQPDRELHYKT